MAAGLATCTDHRAVGTPDTPPSRSLHGASAAHQAQARGVVMGAGQLPRYLPLLRGKRVGLVVNQTSRLGNTYLVDTLKALHVNLTAIFAPEHGFRGEAADGATIANGRDARTG
ncbi:MAG: DUF1343 domain-containing protein, partial [Hymenobacter sp.]